MKEWHVDETQQSAAPVRRRRVVSRRRQPPAARARNAASTPSCSARRSTATASSLSTARRPRTSGIGASSCSSTTRRTRCGSTSAADAARCVSAGGTKPDADRRHELRRRCMHFGFHLGLTDWLELVADIPVSAREATPRRLRPLRLVRPRPIAAVRTGFYADSAFTNVAAARRRRDGLAARLQGAPVPRRHVRARRSPPSSRCPFGDDSAFLGDSGFTFRPDLIGDFTRGAFTAAVNLGAIIRPDTIVLRAERSGRHAAPRRALLDLGHELTWSAGVAYRFVQLGRRRRRTLRLRAARHLGANAWAARRRQGLSPPTSSVASSSSRSRTSPSASAPAPASSTSPTRHDDFRVFGGISWAPAERQGRRGLGRHRHRRRRHPRRARICARPSPRTRTASTTRTAAPIPTTTATASPTSSTSAPTSRRTRTASRTTTAAPSSTTTATASPTRRTSARTIRKTRTASRTTTAAPISTTTATASPTPSTSAPTSRRRATASTTTTAAPTRAVRSPSPAARSSCRRTSSSRPARDSIAGRSRVADGARGREDQGQPAACKRIRIEGHTDDVGGAKKNQELSQARAESVRNFLIRKGVEPERLQAVGYGDTRPLDKRKTAEARAKNRRVEFIIVEQ